MCRRSGVSRGTFLLTRRLAGCRDQSTRQQEQQQRQQAWAKHCTSRSPVSSSASTAVAKVFMPPKALPIRMPHLRGLRVAGVYIWMGSGHVQLCQQTTGSKAAPRRGRQGSTVATSCVLTVQHNSS